jgi:DNA-binding IclR family transcriptional regulator
VGVVDKAAAVLDALAHGPASLGVLVERTGMSRATAHRLASALAVHGLVRRDDDGRFALGTALVALGRTAAEQFPLARVAEPALAALRAETGESVQRVCVASLESPHGLRTIVPTGAVLPLDRGSAGRVLTPGWRPTAQRRWVASVEEREPGVASVSAPVCDAAGDVVAAVGISGPVGRTTRRPGPRFGPAVVAASSAIEEALAAGR